MLRAIDNPADRLAVSTALRSPFFGLSDDDVFQFASGGGTLNPLAPIRDGLSDSAIALATDGPQLAAYKGALAAITAAPVHATPCLLGNAQLVALES